MVHYMSIDGEAWESPNEEPPNFHKKKAFLSWMKRNLPFWVKKYGSRKFGMMNIPMTEFCDLVIKCHALYNGEADFKTFQEYHEWYVGECLWSNSDEHYNQTWPSILGSAINEDYEVLQDGWHRFHSYVKQGKKVMPIIYYV